ncbi:MAG TPA: hypothetical protein VEB40_07460 [Flavipsychrobacter sp.]|nr:hypothetical protein [Flavipsychrobacter sp.]
MKYTLALLAILALASCKKTYKCSCTKKDGTVFTESTWKATKGDQTELEKRCDEQTISYTLQSPLDSPNCVLK